MMRVTRDIERFQFNTAISAMMELLNEMSSYAGEGLPAGADVAWSEAMEMQARLLSPFAPHIACELWEALGHAEMLPLAPWPAFEPALAAEETLEIPVQVNGKVRDRLSVPADIDEESLKQRALASEVVLRNIGTGTVRKVIVIPKKLVNIVVG